MRAIFSFLVITLCISSCTNNNQNFSLLEKQIDNEIKQTENYISEELNFIQRARATGVGKRLEDRYNKILLVSEKTKKTTTPLFETPNNISKNSTIIKTAYVEHVETLMNFVNNDGNPDNDYLVESFSEILGKDFNTKPLKLDKYIDSLLVLNSSGLNNLHLKQLYSQIKNSEFKVWNYLSKYYTGYGISMDYLDITINSVNKLSNDSIIGNIICGSYSSNAIMKLHFGKIDTASFYGGKNKHFPAGVRTIIPIKGDYKTLKYSKNKEFKISNKDLVNQIVEGVIEINHSGGTLFMPFKGKNVW